MSQKCVHDLNKEENTLIMAPRRILVSPEQVECVCSICQKVLKFQKDDEGKFRRIRSIKRLFA